MQAAEGTKGSWLDRLLVNETVPASLTPACTGVVPTERKRAAPTSVQHRWDMAKITKTTQVRFPIMVRRRSRGACFGDALVARCGRCGNASPVWDLCGTVAFQMS